MMPNENDYKQALRELVTAYEAFEAARLRVNDCVVRVLKERYLYPDTKDIKACWLELGLTP